MFLESRVQDFNNNKTAQTFKGFYLTMFHLLVLLVIVEYNQFICVVLELLTGTYGFKEGRRENKSGTINLNSRLSSVYTCRIKYLPCPVVRIIWKGPCIWQLNLSNLCFDICIYTIAHTMTILPVTKCTIFRLLLIPSG